MGAQPVAELSGAALRVGSADTSTSRMPAQTVEVKARQIHVFGSRGGVGGGVERIPVTTGASLGLGCLALSVVSTLLSIAAAFTSQLLTLGVILLVAALVLLLIRDRDV